MAVSNIFSPIGYYKIRAYQVSDVSGEFSDGIYMGSRVVTTVAALVVMIVYGVATCNIEALPAVYLYGIFSIGPIVVDVLHGVDQRLGRMDIIGKSYIMRGVLSLASFCLVFSASQSLELAFASMAILTFTAILSYDWRQTSQLSPGIKIEFDHARIARLLRICLPAVVALLCCSAVPSIPRQVLGSVSGTDILGIYASIAAPVLIVQMGAQYVYTPLLTEFASRFNDGDGSGFWRLFSKATIAIIGITIAGVVFFLVFGDQILELLYGAAIVEYSYALTPLIICTVVTAYVWFVGDLLIAVRDMRGNLLIYLLSLQS